MTSAQPADRTSPGQTLNSAIKFRSSVQFPALLRGPSTRRILVTGPTLGTLKEGYSQSSVGGHGFTQQGLRRRQDLPDEEDRDRVGLEGHHSLLDPLLCQMAIQVAITPSVGLSAGRAADLPAALPLREDLQNLITGLARRVAWGGDRRKGSARIELSVGPLAGSTLIVHADQRSVTVELELAPGSSLAGDWQQRISERLNARGFSAQVRVG